MKTVNFIEASKSGKRFRKILENDETSSWFTIIDNILYYNGTTDFVLLKTDILGMYEVEEKSITITESEFDRIWEDQERYPDLAAIKKELGF